MVADMSFNRIRRFSTGPHCLREAVEEFLEDARLEYELSESGFHIPAGDGDIQCAIACSTAGVLEILVQWCRTAPRERWTAILEALNRINHELVLGHFVLDPEHGSVGFHLCMVAQESCPQWVKRQVDLALRLMAASRPALLGLFCGKLSPSEASSAALHALDAPATTPTPPSGFGWN